MINKPRRAGDYPDRAIDCQEAMRPCFQAIIDCMVEAGWTCEEAKRALRLLIAADNVAQKENAKVEAELAIAGDDPGRPAQAMVTVGKCRAGKAMELVW